jgi:hypothetical protein
MSVASIEKEIDRLENDLELAKKNKLIKCIHCGAKRAAKNIVYIQTLWYQGPYSCTGGDHWLNGEGKFNCLVCGKENRLLGPKSKYYTSPDARLDIENLKYSFKKIKKYYTDGHGGGHYEK